MRLSIKIFVALSMVAVAFIVGRVAGWWGGNDRTDKNDLVAAKSSPSIATLGTTNTGVRPSPRPVKPRLGNATVAPNNPASANPSIPAPTATSPAQPWEDQFDQLLTSTVEDSKKALQFVAMIPRLPAEAQVEAAEHAANLLPDDQYGALSTLLVDPKTPEAVIDVLITDLLDRPNQLKLPLLLEVARVPNHPAGDEAREDLTFFLDEDFGNNWAQWEKSLTAWLKNNKEE